MALVLTVKSGDFIFIGPVTIAILKKKGGHLKVAIEAPKELEIQSSHFLKKQQERKELK